MICTEEVKEEIKDHMFLPRPMLAEEAARLLGCHDLELVEERIDALVERKRLVVEPADGGENVFLIYFWRTEREIASQLVRSARARKPAGSGQDRRRRGAGGRAACPQPVG